MSEQKEIQKIDAKSKVLGRLAVELADLLRGKNSADFVYHQDKGEKVIVFNTDFVKLTGKKIEQKKYIWHTGYPGGLKTKPVLKQKKEDSREIIRKAVWGMLPKNKLRNVFINKMELHQKEISEK